MSRNSNLFHSQDYQALTVETDAENEVQIAEVQGVSIVPNCTVDQFYSADSNKIGDQVQHEFQVDVEIDYSYFDGDIVEEWLGGSGAAQGNWEDTSDPEKFNIRSYEGVSRDGSNVLTCDVIGITFEEMPIVGWDQGDMDEWNLSGIGEDIENFDVSAPTE